MSGKNKLTSEERTEVLRQLAAFCKVSEVVKFIKDNFGKTLHYMSVKHYATSPKWAPVIARFREEYKAGIMEEPLASKRRRLQLLWDCYERAVAKGNNSLAIKAIRQANREMKKFDASQYQSSLYNPQAGNTGYNLLTDEELEQIRLETEKERQQKDGPQ